MSPVGDLGARGRVLYGGHLPVHVSGGSPGPRLSLPQDSGRTHARSPVSGIGGALFLRGRWVGDGKTYRRGDNKKKKL